MQNIFSTVFLSDTDSLIPPLLFLGIGIATIILDLRNRRRERGQGRQRVWYQRILILTGILLIITGLMVLPFADLIMFPLPQWFSSLLPIACLFVIVALGIYAFLILIRHTLQLSQSPRVIFVGRSNSEQGVVAANPLLLITRMILIAETFFLGMITLLGIFQLFSLVISHQQFLGGWSLLVVVPFLVFLLMRMSTRLRTLQRIERLRFTLTAERSADSVSLWPLSASSTFSAPLSITLRIKRTHIGIFAVLIAGFLIPLTIHLVVQFMQPGPFFGQSDIFSLLFWLVFGLTPLVIGFIPLFIARTTIEAKENGLRTEAGTFIHWHEARLFACYKLPDLIPGRRTTGIYEVSSHGRVITWRWIHDAESPLTLWKPLLPSDEYHRQMQSLCDLVIEKTGLPLHDLTQRFEEEEADST